MATSSQGAISSTIRDLFAYASLPCTYQPVTTLIMATASAGINAGFSDVSAPTMFARTVGPGPQG